MTHPFPTRRSSELGIDFADRRDSRAAIVHTLRQVFPVVEVWAERSAPAPDARLVFIVLAGETPSAFAQMTSAPPDALPSGRLTPAAVDALVEIGRASCRGRVCQYV